MRNRMCGTVGGIQNMRLDDDLFEGFLISYTWSIINNGSKIGRTCRTNGCIKFIQNFTRETRR